MSEHTGEGADGFEARIQRLVDPHFFELDRNFFRDELRRGVRRFFWPLGQAVRTLQGLTHPAYRDHITPADRQGVVVPKPPRVKMRGYSIRKR